MKKNLSIYLFVISLSLSCFSGCTKFVDLSPSDGSVIDDAVFSSDSKATSALLGIYSNMINNGNQFSNWMVTAYAGQSADEFLRFSPTPLDAEIQTNQITVTNTSIGNVWNTIYSNIYKANQIIHGCSKSTSLSIATKNQLIAEAKFIRALCYFYAVNLYGDVPLVLGLDYTTNAIIGRNPSDEIWTQIKADLTAAKATLGETYINNFKNRPNKWAAAALLARVYLYRKEWALAENEATEIINSGLYTPLITPATVFNRNSKEAIFQLSQTNTTTREYTTFATIGGVLRYYLTNTVMQSFETGDLRRAAWVDSTIVNSVKYYRPSKYKSTANAQSYMVLRIGEILLIRSEARLRQNKDVEARGDIDIIRQRGGLSILIGTYSNTQLFNELMNQRIAELFVEWGHRWFDLKRNDLANTVLTVAKGSTWQTTDQLWPIPNAQRLTNPALTQNPGY